jgi:RNA polymerase sigma-70 factor (ECF subfamily)
LLYSYAYNILRNKDICEEIVQETFFSLWTKRQELQITHSLKAFLITSVKFQALNYIRSEKVRKDYAVSYTTFENGLLFDNSNEENINLSDLKSKVENEVSKLPPKCQQIFRLSRDENQSIKNIADSLNISHKTVENQLTKALKHLRASLNDLLLLVIISFSSILISF